MATPGANCIGELADDAIAILDVLEMSWVNFCGLSMGGMIGLWLGLHAPARINRLVTANGAAHIAPAQFWDERMAMVQRHGMPITSPAKPTRSTSSSA